MVSVRRGQAAQNDSESLAGSGGVAHRQSLDGSAHDALLGPTERVVGRRFSDPEETQHDALIMRDLLLRERAAARIWPQDAVARPLVSEAEAGRRQLLVVPDRAALLDAGDVTAVGFFGRLREDIDHSSLFELEQRVVRTFPAFAKLGLLSYYDLGLERGRYGNLILFWTPDVPEQWHANASHRRAVAAAPHHYDCIRLHKGRIVGPFLGDGELLIERTQYIDFSREQIWRALRVYSQGER